MWLSVVARCEYEQCFVFVVARLFACRGEFWTSLALSVVERVLDLHWAIVIFATCLAE
jgi:hypothetical protein